VFTYHVDARSGSSRGGEAETLALAWEACYGLAEEIFLDGERTLMSLHVDNEVAFMHFGATADTPEGRADAVAFIHKVAAEKHAELYRRQWLTAE
jgi:hypothetical protein